MNHWKIQNASNTYYTKETNEIIKKYSTMELSYNKVTVFEVDPNIVKFDVIKNMVCDFYSVSHSDIESKGRFGMVKEARHTIAYLTRMTTYMSLARIGMLLGGRDHATMLNSMKRKGLVITISI